MEFVKFWLMPVVDALTVIESRPGVWTQGHQDQTSIILKIKPGFMTKPGFDNC